MLQNNIISLRIKIALFVLFLTITVLFLSFHLYSTYYSIYDEERHKLATHGKISKDAILAHIAHIDRILNKTREILESQTTSDPKALALIVTTFKRQMETNPIISAMVIASMDGKPILAVGNDKKSSGAISEVLLKKAQQKGSFDLLYHGLRSEKIEELFILQYGKIFVDKDSGKKTLIVVEINPLVVDQSLEAVFYAPHMGGALMMEDGQFFATLPKRKNIVGQNVIGKNKTIASFFDLNNTSETATIIHKSSYNGKDLLVVFQKIVPKRVKLDGFVVINTFKPIEEVFARFYRSMFVAIVIYLSFAIVILLFFLLWIRSIKIAHKQEEIISKLEAERLLASAVSKQLTTIANREFFARILKVDEKKPLALLLCDIDNFQKYNDFYGKDAGDRTLDEVAMTLKNELNSPSEIMTRFGSDKFLMIISGSTKKSLETKMASIRKKVEGLDIEHEKTESGKLTISVAGFVLDSRYKNLAIRLMELMKNCKHQGGNCIMLESERE